MCVAVAYYARSLCVLLRSLSVCVTRAHCVCLHALTVCALRTLTVRATRAHCVCATRRPHLQAALAAAHIVPSNKHIYSTTQVRREREQHDATMHTDVTM